MGYLLPFAQHNVNARSLITNIYAELLHQCKLVQDLELPITHLYLFLEENTRNTQ